MLFGFGLSLRYVSGSGMYLNLKGSYVMNRLYLRTDSAANSDTGGSDDGGFGLSFSKCGAAISSCVGGVKNKLVSLKDGIKSWF